MSTERSIKLRRAMVSSRACVACGALYLMYRGVVLAGGGERVAAGVLVIRTSAIQLLRGKSDVLITTRDLAASQGQATLFDRPCDQKRGMKSC